MKRILLSIIFLFACFYYINAQQISENFETVVVNEAVTLPGWINSAQVGTRTWLGKEYSANKYAQGTSYNSGEANTFYLITPKLNVAGNSETFSFDINVGYWTHNALTVLISTDFDGTEGGISTATWTDITSNFTIPETPTSGYGTIATAGTMDISSYTGTPYIAFVYTGDGNTNLTTTIQVDNVVITGIPYVGITNLSHNLTISPNPANSFLNITSGTTINEISVSNMIGQKVMTINNVNSKNYVLDIKTTISGVYIINIKNSDGSMSLTKFVKE
jgi:hypothetical protein